MGGFLGACALLLAALAWLRSQVARNQVRCLQSTVEEMIGLMEVLSDRNEVFLAADRPPSQAEPAALTRNETAEQLGRARVPGFDIHRRVLELDGSGTSRSGICRETGLSHGEVKLLLALAQRAGGMAG